VKAPLCFGGYAVLWDRVDRAGDVFRAGAFGAGDVPLLWQHRGAAVGRIAATPDVKGLRVRGELHDAGVTDLVLAGVLDGLSVGYRARRVRQGAWREIVDAELVEVSLVAQPMQPGARLKILD
jgi:HK97 family phage prohead protease